MGRYGYQYNAVEPDPGNETRPSGCQVVDVDFHSPIPESVGCITFRNHYTHTLTLKYCCTNTGQISNSNSDPTLRWKTCMERLQLMPNCHCERGSQTLVVLNRACFSVPLEKVSRLRLILRQPSPYWKQFGIRDLKCYLVPTPFCQDVTQGNGRMGIDHSSISLTERMESVLQTGLWTETSGIDMESGPELPTERRPYNISVLS